MKSQSLVVGAVGIGMAAGLALGAPQIEELGWVLEQEIVSTNPISALFNPQDGRIYAGQRSGDIFVFDADGVRTKVEDTDDVAGLCVDPRSGDLFLSEDFPGNIERIPLGSTLASTWVNGFDGGDDDPVGIAFVPEDYAGTLLTAGGMVSTDRGFGSADEVWAWSPLVAQGETELVDAPVAMGDPVDIAVRADGLILVADAATGLVELLDDGSAVAFAATPPIPAAQAVVFDGRSDDAFVYDGGAGTIVRVDTLTGAASVVISGIEGAGVNWGSLNLDDGPETQRLVVGSTDADRIWVFAAVPGCNNADLALPFGVLDLSDINLFVNAFTGQNPIADFDDNGIWDLSDVIDYIDAFVGGCP